MSKPSAPPDVILFDLGGVLVQLTGVPTMMRWTEGRFTVSELWGKWLLSPSGRAFESGRISPEAFAEAMVDEFALPVSPSEYLEEFTEWVSAPYPGTLELLANLSRSYTLGCLSNTNALHWDRMRHDMGLGAFFDYAFASHEMGLVKPDAEAFLRPIAEMKTIPERVLYFDDNRLNVDAAAAIGMDAYRVDGAEGVSRKLREFGMLP